MWTTSRSSCVHRRERPLTSLITTLRGVPDSTARVTPPKRRTSSCHPDESGPPSGPGTSSTGRRARSRLDREILALAVPALGALVAEPLFVLVDSAVVGHLGTAQLAGLSLASTLLVTLVGLCVFLAYATTAAVARRIGAGHTREALQSGIDGLWLAVGLGALLAAVLWTTAPWAVLAMGGPGELEEPHVV